MAVIELVSYTTQYDCTRLYSALFTCLAFRRHVVTCTQREGFRMLRDSDCSPDREF